MAERTVRPRPDHPRSPGIHVQAVNRALGIAAGKLLDSDSEDSPFEKFSDETYPLMAALGVAWEELRASLYTDEELVWQTQELERDGIYGTPDGLWLAGQGEIAIWECKQTTKKVQPVVDIWMYVKQGLSYCAMSQSIQQVLYDVCFLLGDYSRPYQPIATQTLVEFSQKEMESWWGNVKQAARNVKAEGPAEA